MRRLCFPSILALAVGAVGLVPSTARADDRVIAQEAFQEGRALMAAGKVAEACPKFAAAAQLSQTAGVRLNLAECWARLGRTASAWGKANEALSLAERAGDAAATTLARERMAALQPRLSYLTIVVAREGAPPGLEVALDGETVPAPVWGTALPVDPGPHEVSARAPGRTPVSVKATVAGDAARVTVAVPALVAASETPPALAPPSAPAQSDTAGGGSSRTAVRAIALVGAGLGVVGLGIGTAFALDANAKKGDYQQRESGGTCDAECVSLSKDAVGAATASTIAFVAGGALVAAGAVLWLTAPGGGDARGVAVAPILGPRGMGAGVTGSFQ